MKGQARFLEWLQLFIITATPMINTNMLRHNTLLIRQRHKAESISRDQMFHCSLFLVTTEHPKTTAELTIYNDRFNFYLSQKFQLAMKAL